MVGRREFLAAGILAGIGGFAATAQAASATRSRLFVSSYPIRRIARDLVHGIGRQVIEYVRGLPPGHIEDLVSGLTREELRARLQTLRGNIDVALDEFRLTRGDHVAPGTISRFFQRVVEVATLDDDSVIDPDERALLREILLDTKRDLLEIIEEASLTIRYRLRYKSTWFSVVTHAERGHFRIELRLLTPVREVTGALFVADLQERGACTYINTSLCINACVGRREGPLVRRIAGRVIGNLECEFLARLESEVYKLVHNEAGSELKKMIPELVRRITDGA